MSASAFAQVLRFVWRYWRRSPRLLAALVVLRIASSLIDVATPFAAGHLVDAVAAEVRDVGRVIEALAWLLGIVLAFQILRSAVEFIIIRFTADAMSALVGEAFARVQRFSADWHANSFAGATVRKITRGMWAFDTFTDAMVFQFAPAIIVILTISTIFLARWPMLGVLVTLSIFAYLAVSIGLSVAWVAPASSAAQALDSRMSASLADALTANAAVKAFAAEPREEASFAGLTAAWKARTLVSWRRGAYAGIAQSGVLLGMQVLMLGAGIWLWARGEVGPGDMASLVSVQALVRGYLRDIGQHVRNAQRALNEMEDVAAFCETAPHVDDMPGARPLIVSRGEITFDKASFGYAAGAGLLFDRLSLEIRPGEKVGLVGPSGSGKSTFVKLLQRLYDLDDGRILIDGQDIAGVTQASLRRAIGLVPQDPALFHRSIAENIAYGRPDATPAEIAESATLAHADLFVEALPAGYRTLVGERGVKLSGGERQRVAIARAILAGTPILVLDEATSSLDSVSEALIRDAIDHLSAGRTTIVVAHRLSTVQRLDRILVFKAGRIIEDGTHKELVAKPGGVYRRLFETQNEGALSEDPDEEPRARRFGWRSRVFS
ncbi:ABC transporter ATP-binding protein [Methylocapsa acidiphila]|uniref:ABC transporter ATP-binding protein n=1 Tax=Methylocapsa acidiphila TaxID=133552 RepID=UPI000A05B730|nr:ABC transporter ATP-binding protein [Methylocapsa acidiphila]